MRSLSVICSHIIAVRIVLILAYCSYLTVQNLTIQPPSNSPNTDEVDPDSSNHVCIEDCFISSGDVVIAIKNGWDEHSISFAPSAGSTEKLSLPE
ncbi:hypothetical protein MLD38_019916 [Melastoma candidum]|nr:hypothetical protein MLD38_019916 [Melastoma candidum]